MYWEITPHEDKDYDICIMPAGTVEDDNLALKCAQDRLEALWDLLEAGETGSVTMSLVDSPISEELEELCTTEE